jgi:hypothetical protein
MEPAPICDAMEMGKKRLKMIRDKGEEMLLHGSIRKRSNYEAGLRWLLSAWRTKGERLNLVAFIGTLNRLRGSRLENCPPTDRARWNGGDDHDCVTLEKML